MGLPEISRVAWQLWDHVNHVLWTVNAQVYLFIVHYYSNISAQTICRLFFITTNTWWMAEADVYRYIMFYPEARITDVYIYIYMHEDAFHLTSVKIGLLVPQHQIEKIKSGKLTQWTWLISRGIRWTHDQDKRAVAQQHNATAVRDACNHERLHIIYDNIWNGLNKKTFGTFKGQMTLTTAVWHEYIR